MLASSIERGLGFRDVFAVCVGSRMSVNGALTNLYNDMRRLDLVSRRVRV